MGSIKNLYILRHGQTDLNKQGMVQGRGVDSSLNGTGKEQAIRVFNHLKEVDFDLFCSSTLRRTHETLAPFNSHFEQHEGFDEISWGSHEGALPTNRDKNAYLDTVNEWQNGNLNVSVGGGETPMEVMERQKLAMQEVLSNGADKILICMHGRAMRILLCWLLNYDLRYMDGFEHTNCSYYRLSTMGGRFTLHEYNRTSHLNH